MRIIRNLILALLLIVSGIALLLMIPSPQPDAIKPWEVSVKPDGNVEVLGIHLGQTDYQTAQHKLNAYGTTALFIDKDGTKGVEAFFDSVNLGGLSAKLVMNIAVPETELDAMFDRAGAGKLQPSGAHQYGLADIDKQSLLARPVKSLIYAPSFRLTKDMVKNRFGEAEDIKPLPANEDGVAGEIWLYPRLSLNIVFEPSERPVLMFKTQHPIVD